MREQMKLYHGTSQRAASAAVVSGIHPRKQRKGNWKHTVTSRSDAVYLTDAYAMYFAINAQKNQEEKVAVIEIDSSLLNPWLLAPDEDALEQINRGKDQLDPCLTMEQRTKIYRKQLHKYTGNSQWEASIKTIGNCCYLSSVPMAAITRIAIINVAQAPIYCMNCMDPTITIMNYQILGNKYRGLTKWLFGDDLGIDSPKERVSLEDLQATHPLMDKHTLDSIRFDYLLPPDAERSAVEIIQLK